MAYRVELSRRAQRDLEDIHEVVSGDESIAAAAWFEGLSDALYSLERFPRRCPIAPDSKESEPELRHLLYGAKRNVYRVLFDIDESRKIVRIVTIRHGAMDEFPGVR